MPEQDKVLEQQKLLKIHRVTLSHYLTQQAMLGTAYAPPNVTHGILEARDNIRRIKKVLRTWGIYVEDLPNDEETADMPYATWHKTPVSLEEFSTNLLEEVDRVTAETVKVITGLNEYPYNISGNKLLMKPINENISKIEIRNNLAIDITCLDENRKYFVHPWFPKIVGRPYVRQWAPTQGIEFTEWFWEKALEMRKGYLTWLDALASKPEFFSYSSIGEYKRKTIVSFMQIPIGPDLFWTVAVEGHEIAKFQISVLPKR
jgi:hypothetical protein